MILIIDVPHWDIDSLFSTIRTMESLVVEKLGPKLDKEEELVWTIESKCGPRYYDAPEEMATMKLVLTVSACHHGHAIAIRGHAASKKVDARIVKANVSLVIKREGDKWIYHDTFGLNGNSTPNTIADSIVTELCKGLDKS